MGGVAGEYHRITIIAMKESARRGSVPSALVFVCGLLFNGVSYCQVGSTPTGQLTLLDALQSTLAAHPALRIQEQEVVTSRAVKQQASGRFDAVLASGFSQSRTNLPLSQFEKDQAALIGITADHQAINLTDFSLGASKLYRSGVVIGPAFQATRTTDNFENLPGANLSNLTFQVIVPLLRGRGRDVVAAQERAAGIAVDASLLDLNQTISDLLAETASRYWAAVAARRILEVVQGSEERGRTYVETVETLIQAGRVPQAEINQVQANFSDRTAERIAAEQGVIEARQQLALAMGLTADQIATVGSPSQGFPPDEGNASLTVDRGTIQGLFELALQRRADLLASRKRESEAQTLLVAARNQTRPQVDLSFNTGYTALAEGRGFSQIFQSPFRNAQGPDLFGGITYRFPPSNNVARGQLLQTQAGLRQAELRTLEISRTTMATVGAAAQGVRNTALALGKAREAVTAFQAALDGEREKYRLGVGSLVDILTMEDRLTVAQRTHVNAELAYALALVRLRSVTGTIVEPDKPVQSVDGSVFLSLPAVPAAKSQP